jgi:hypothetical protein
MNVQIGEVYKHFKGDLVRVTNLTTDSETLEKRVVYHHLYGDPTSWDRKLSMWEELVLWPHGVLQPRFMLEKETR